MHCNNLTMTAALKNALHLSCERRHCLILEPIRTFSLAAAPQKAHISALLLTKHMQPRTG